jgi:hypothetical protein
VATAIHLVQVGIGEHLHRKGVIDGYTHFELKTLGAGLATIALAGVACASSSGLSTFIRSGLCGFAVVILVYTIPAVGMAMLMVPALCVVRDR